MQISTTLNNTKLWSGISGETISVSPDKGYEVLTHMKLNNWSTASHIVVEGFNQTSKQWNQQKRQQIRCSDIVTPEVSTKA